MGKVFATTSGKGGVGKSTAAVGIATAFCRMGSTVLLVDMDLGLGCLDLLLGIDDTAVMDLYDVLSGTPLEDAAYRCSEKNLFLLPAPSRFVPIDPDAFRDFGKKAREKFDIVIFDFPAGIDFSLYPLLPKTLFITVAVPDPVSVRDASSVSARLYEMGLKSRLLINRFTLKSVTGKNRRNIDDIIDTAALRLLGIIPESRDLGSIPLNRIKNRCPAMKSCIRIARRLQEENVPLPNPKKL